MPKITKHGGATNANASSAGYFSDEPLGDPEPELPAEVKEDESSVGNSFSQSSKPTQTIDELLGIDRP